MVEGIENRPNPNPRRKDKIKPEVLDGNCTVLSPQRRGFSSGCRAASPHKSGKILGRLLTSQGLLVCIQLVLSYHGLKEFAEAEPERLGTNKGNWRSGAGFMLKNSTATNDFKPSFVSVDVI